MQRLMSKPEESGGTRQEWLDCLREIVEVHAIHALNKCSKIIRRWGTAADRGSIIRMLACLLGMFFRYVPILVVSYFGAVYK